MSESEANAKKNKLGYQRISIACAHCRRRKIRCVMAENDEYHRCANCIRLGKECVFHPVDAEAGSSSSPAISHSPRDLAAGQSFETRPSNYTRLAPLPSTGHDFTSLAYDSSAQGTPSSAVFDYRAQQFPDTRWPMSSEIGASIPPQPINPDTGHGIYFNNSTDEFGNVPSHRALSPDSRSFSFSGGLADDSQWHMMHQSGRSMSYGHFDSHPHPPYTPSHNMAPHPIAYPLDTHSAANIRSVSGPHSAPLGAIQPQGQPFSFQDVQMPQQGVLGTWFAPNQQHQPHGDFDSGQKSNRSDPRRSQQ